MSARRTRANYGEIDIEQLQHETDKGHVSQRRTWVYPVPQVPLRFIHLLLLN